MGDVDFAEVSEKAGFITPVPGGVGPMTVAMLMNNTVDSAIRASKELHNTQWNLSLLDLNPRESVPSDIDVARAQTPKDVDLLASEIKQNSIGSVIEKQSQSFPSTGRRQYHAVTRGWVANELFRRVHPEGKMSRPVTKWSNAISGLTIGEFLSENVSKSLEARVFIGE